MVVHGAARESNSLLLVCHDYWGYRRALESDNNNTIINMHLIISLEVELESSSSEYNWMMNSLE